MRMNALALRLSLLSHLILLSSALGINAPMLDVYDYIIVGGGASGLTVANRLSENPDMTILVLEAGPADNYEDTILIPVEVGRDIISAYNWNLSSVPQIYLDGRVRSIPQGRGLGGGTLINALLWNRGGQDDYNDWAALGNPGWDWDSMLPYFMRSETFTNDVSEANADQFYIHPDPSVHGTSGPVNVTFSKYFYNSSQLFFEGLADLGIPIANDPNEGSIAGAYFLPLDIDPNNMTRSDARLSYYEPYSFRPNFNVQVGKQVTRVLFDNSSCMTGTGQGLRAIGVEYATSSTSPRYNVYARREVIMAAGSLHTPQILELSGLGQPSVLSQYGITTLLNLPGLGNNLQDHYLTGFNWPYLNENYILPSLLGSDATFAAAAEAEYYTSRTGPWTAGPPNGVAFPSLPDISPNNSANIIAAAAAQDPSQYLPPGMDDTVLAGYQAMHGLMVAALGNPNRAVYELLNANTGYFTQSIMRPFSRGTTHIVSLNPFVSPAIDPRYCSNPTDMAILLETYRFQFRLMSTPSMQLLQAATWIPYPSASDDQLISLIQQITETEYHVSGSCAMLPLELGGVVDANVLVYGTQNLRIVDASIQPMPPAAHLQAVVYGVAEKCADLIRAAPAWTTVPTMVLPPPTTATECSVSSSSSITATSNINVNTMASQSSSTSTFTNASSSTTDSSSTSSSMSSSSTSNSNSSITTSVINSTSSISVLTMTSAASNTTSSFISSSIPAPTMTSGPSSIYSNRSTIAPINNSSTSTSMSVMEITSAAPNATISVTTSSALIVTTTGVVSSAYSLNTSSTLITSVANSSFSSWDVASHITSTSVAGSVSNSSTPYVTSPSSNAISTFSKSSTSVAVPLTNTSSSTITVPTSGSASIYGNSSGILSVTTSSVSTGSSTTSPLSITTSVQVQTYNSSNGISSITTTGQALRNSSRSLLVTTISVPVSSYGSSSTTLSVTATSANATIASTLVNSVTVTSTTLTSPDYSNASSIPTVITTSAGSTISSNSSSGINSTTTVQPGGPISSTSSVALRSNSSSSSTAWSLLDSSQKDSFTGIATTALTSVSSFSASSTSPIGKSTKIKTKTHTYTVVETSYYTVVSYATSTVMYNQGSTSAIVYATTPTSITFVTATYVSLKTVTVTSKGHSRKSSLTTAIYTTAATVTTKITSTAIPSTSSTGGMVYITVETTYYTTICPATATITDSAGSISTSVYNTTSTVTALVTSTFTSTTSETTEALPTSSNSVGVSTTTKTTSLTTVYLTATTITDGTGGSTTSVFATTSTYDSVITIAYSTTTSTVTQTPVSCKTIPYEGRPTASTTSQDFSGNGHPWGNHPEGGRSVGIPSRARNPVTITMRTTYYKTVCACATRPSSSSAPPAMLGFEPAVIITPQLTPTMGFPWGPPAITGAGPASLGFEPAVVITPQMSPTMGFPWGPPAITGAGTVKPEWRSWSSKEL